MTAIRNHNPVTDATAMLECADLVSMADWHAKQSAEFHAIGGMLNEIRAARHAKEAKRHYSMAADYMSQAYA